MVNMGLKADGGITVYYIPPYDGKSKVTAFKPVRIISSVPGIQHHPPTHMISRCVHCTSSGSASPVG